MANTRNLKQFQRDEIVRGVYSRECDMCGGELIDNPSDVDDLLDPDELMTCNDIIDAVAPGGLCSRCEYLCDKDD
jgi:hypothetical protein